MPAINVPFLAKAVLVTGSLIGLPLLGVYADGQHLQTYLEFPPVTRYVTHAPFSWWVFMPLSAVIAGITGGLAVGGLRTLRQDRPAKTPRVRRPMTWWGWFGLVALLSTWVVAWNRFDWMKPLQAHTFTPLWLAYILVVNALCQRQTGNCLLRRRPVYFLILFPVSAGFWWFFEYLNRFVQNWYYIGPEFGPWSYFWYATLPFSTVLPAVLSTSEWLRQGAWVKEGFSALPPVPLKSPRRLAMAALTASAAGLIFIGVWPNLLFPLLWLSPLLIIGSLATLSDQRHIFSEMASGDWSRAVAAAVAALVCGIFWEMWNIHSLAKWEYSIPFVHKFKIFEMPVLGFAGYLPFGLECVVIGDLLKKVAPQRTR